MYQILQFSITNVLLAASCPSSFSSSSPFIFYISGDLRDDTNPEFIREYQQALAVVCDDLFFARYRRSSNLAQTLANDNGNVEKAAGQFLEIVFNNRHNEESKSQGVEDLIDMKLLPGTDGKGVHFNSQRIADRWGLL